MKRTAAQMADALTAVLEWEAREGGLEAPAFKQARAALRAYDRATKPKPKGAPGLCPVCRHHGEDCTCHRRPRHVRI